VIAQDFITEWRQQAPWTHDSQVEQDLIVSRTLVDVYSRSEVASALALRGGTALYKLHLSPPARYSEDIDLVQVEAGPIGPLLNAVRESLGPWLGEPRRVFKEGRITLVYRMQSEGPPSLPMRLKIEINSREHFSAFDLEDRPLSIESRWYAGSAVIRTYHLDELLGTKLRALYQRKKGRDIFDLWEAQRVAHVDPARLVRCFLHYLQRSGSRVSRAEFEANLAAKIDDPRFTQDIEPLLASHVEWDFEDAVRYVQEELVTRIPGSPWKGGSADR
jgi:predicted nucleotidyltransferase component of viral defense system